jgi:hypothetical protein
MTIDGALSAYARTVVKDIGELSPREYPARMDEKREEQEEFCRCEWQLFAIERSQVALGINGKSVNRNSAMRKAYRHNTPPYVASICGAGSETRMALQT